MIVGFVGVDVKVKVYVSIIVGFLDMFRCYVVGNGVVDSEVKIVYDIYFCSSDGDVVCVVVVRWKVEVVACVFGEVSVVWLVVV